MSLIIDEADQIMKVGFELEMNQILDKLPNERQTVLFSATQTKKVEDLARLSLTSPIYIGVDDEAKVSTVQGLEQGYVVCDSDYRFRLLFTFLKKNRKKKIMVFFSSCNSVKVSRPIITQISSIAIFSIMSTSRLWTSTGNRSNRRDSTPSTSSPTPM